MNKIISFVLLGALLLMCFSGCAAPNEKSENNLTESHSLDALICTLIEYLKSLSARKRMIIVV